MTTSQSQLNFNHLYKSKMYLKCLILCNKAPNMSLSVLLSWQSYLMLKFFLAFFLAFHLTFPCDDLFALSSRDINVLSGILGQVNCFFFKSLKCRKNILVDQKSFFALETQVNRKLHLYTRYPTGWANDIISPMLHDSKADWFFENGKRYFKFNFLW